MEPIPETVEALRNKMRYGHDKVDRTLLHISREVKEIVPEVVGISLSSIDENVTLTMTATTGPTPSSALPTMEEIGDGQQGEGSEREHGGGADGRRDTVRRTPQHYRGAMMAQATRTYGSRRSICRPPDSPMRRSR